MASTLSNDSRREVGRGRYLHPASSRRGGFSLIEVVIALGIFVFGALAIIQIFPGSLGVIQGSEQRAVGQRMAQTSLERLTNAPLSVPEAIIDVHPSLTSLHPSGWSDFPAAVVGTTIRNDSLPRNPAAQDDIAPDNANTNLASPLVATAAGRFRRILSEERVVAREFTSTGTARGVITLRYPFVFPAAAQAVHAPILQEVFAVNGVTVDNNGALDFRNATAPDGSSLSDTTFPERPALALRIQTPNPTDREGVTVYISYRYRIGTQPIQAVVDEPIRFPQNGGDWGSRSGLPLAKAAQTVLTDATIITGPIQVKVRRDVVPAVALTATDVEPNLGRIFLPNTFIGRRISVDYSVPDWRMIVHDDTLSTRLSPSDVAYLTQDLGYTAATGTNQRQTVVPTRFITDEQLSTAPVAARPSQAYLLLRGAVTSGPGAGQARATSAEWSPDPGRFANTPTINPAATNGSPGALGVRPKSGQVFFDVTNLTSPSTRVVYRNADGWLEQPAVAARSIVPFVGRGAITASPGESPDQWPREPWREYFYNSGAASGAGTVSPQKAIVLRASEAGNTYLVTYTLSTNVTMRDVPVTAETEVSNVDFAPAGFFGQYRDSTTNRTTTTATLLYLPDVNGAKIGLPVNEGGSTVNQHVTSILSIKGASVRVRSAWFDGGRYSQAVVTGYRSLDVESATRS